MKTPVLSLFAKLTAAILLAGFAVLPLQAAPKKILVVTVTTGFRHGDSIAVGEKVMEKLAKESGAFTVDFIHQPEHEPQQPRKPKDGEDDTKYKEDMKAFQEARKAWNAEVAKALEPLNPGNLKNYDAVMFLNTTGDLPLPDKQGFVDWIAAGHGFIGTHSASDTFHGFRPYLEMLGGEFKTHGAQVTVECLNQDNTHPATKDLPSTWVVHDEIYQMTPVFKRDQVHGLLTLDKHPNNKTPGDYPIAWCKEVGKGKIFYTSLGHRTDVWTPDTPANFKRENPKEVAEAYQKHLLGGIKWALGLEAGSAKP